MQVILIDDDTAILSILDYVLSQMGIEVVCSPCPGILKNISDNKPLLILIDIWLPGSNGGDICRTLKTAEATKDIPVVLISAVNDLEIIANESFADGFIEKPFDLDTIEKMVLKYIPASHNK